MSADLLTVVSDYKVFLLLSDVHYLVYQSEIGPKHLWFHQIGEKLFERLSKMNVNIKLH